MRAIFGVVVLLVGAFAVFGGDPFDEVLRHRGSRAGSGCPIPLSLHVDRVDPRFELNRGDVRRAVAEAVAIWESATDTSLFRQAPGEGMAVTLIFDERQATADARADRRDGLTAARERLKSEQRRMQRSRRALAAANEALRRHLEDYRRRQRQHERAIAAWNAGETVQTAAKRDRLNRRTRKLQAQRDALKQQRQTLRSRSRVLQQQRRDLARQAEDFNERVQTYNRSAAEASGFQMARFIRQGSERSIKVFKASNYEELRLALAHELGHSLGIGHVPEPTALMNAERTTANKDLEALTAADRRALSVACDVAWTPP